LSSQVSWNRHAHTEFHTHTGGTPCDSNIDWGQDLFYLKRWLDKHPEARPLHLAFHGSYDAGVAGIEYAPPPTEPKPGWHALSVNKIRSRSREYEYFLRFEPVAMAGYSIYIYHVTLDEANHVRRELGLPELPGPQPEPDDLPGTSRNNSTGRGGTSREVNQDRPGRVLSETPWFGHDFRPPRDHAALSAAGLLGRTARREVVNARPLAFHRPTSPGRCQNDFQYAWSVA